jgi:choline dehydrogenase-like flavoprotein
VSIFALFIFIRGNGNLTTFSNRIFDFIVVGSGAAGGLIAHHLQERGADILLIEAGKRFTKETFPQYEADASSQLYWGGGLELARDASMGFLRAKTLGGTTIVNQALLDRFDSVAWDDWKSISGVPFFSPDSMDEYYSAVESFLKWQIFSESDFNESARLVSQSMSDLGYQWKYLRRGQSNCATERGNDCIACLGGCHRDSKQSSLVTYIKQAEQKGLKIQTETQVASVQAKASHVELHVDGPQGKHVLKANRLVLSAGSLGTTQILLKSGFKKQYPALGRGFAAHPQFMSFGKFDHPINAHQACFQSIASSDPSFRSQGFKLEVVYAPPVSLAILFPFYGQEHRRMMQGYTRYSCVEVAIRDENVGQLSIDRKGRLVIDKPLTDLDRQKRDTGLEAVRNIMTQAGTAEVIQSPVYFGLHLMGGAAIGCDQSQSIVNPEFQMHCHPRIHIVDSSIFPCAPGINPSLTIFALAEKFSRSLIGRGHEE